MASSFFKITEEWQNKRRMVLRSYYNYLLSAGTGMCKRDLNRLDNEYRSKLFKKCNGIKKAKNKPAKDTK